MPTGVKKMYDAKHQTSFMFKKHEVDPFHLNTKKKTTNKIAVDLRNFCFNGQRNDIEQLKPWKGILGSDPIELMLLKHESKEGLILD